MNYYMSTGIIIIDKSGTPKSLNVKEFNEEDLYKKCGFKKPDGLIKQHTWNVKVEKQKYNVSVFAKEDGKANMENKYDFPPPIDTKLFFGSCALTAQIKNAEGKLVNVNLTLELWEKIYEKLFGGFEDLALTCKEDDLEEDELEHVPKHKKTKDGYLKDGFVVDSDKEDDDSDSFSDTSEGENSREEGDREEDNGNIEAIEDIGSELSEDSYDYSSDSA
jgi:hypothetical protein